MPRVAPTQQPAKVQALSPASFHILLALVDGEQHGYAIMRDVRESTDDAVRLGPGTLYRVIESLLGAGMIQEVERKQPSRDDERRRYYRLTPLGHREVRAEAQRLARTVALAEAKQLLLPRRS